jgi:transcriptional regulator with XRE-family HTH domain
MEALDQARCKAARALLNWTAAQLADAAGLSLDTLRSFESGRSKTLNRENERSILSALKVAGVYFVEAGDIAKGAGVTLDREHA